MSANWNLIGHEWAVQLLRGQIAAGRLRHAYLITGPDGVGRRTLALRLAQALNCSHPPAPGEFCGECRACLNFARGQHPDLLIVDYQLPGLGGPEVCSRLQADAATRGLPVVLMMPAGVRYPRANTGPVQIVARPCGPRQILAAAERLIGAAV